MTLLLLFFSPLSSVSSSSPFPVRNLLGNTGKTFFAEVHLADEWPSALALGAYKVECFKFFKAISI